MTAGSDVPPVRILFVAGTGRSGTTIINTVLGQVPGAFTVGELRYVWERGLGEDHRCGCGEPFSRCPVWVDVIERAFGPNGPPDPELVSQGLLRRLRMLRLPAMVGRSLFGRPPVPSHADDKAIAALYRAVQASTGAQVIIDSSKLPPYGAILQRLSGVELYVLRVVRDPRANAFSWRRTKRTHDRDDGAIMERLPLWRSAAMWLAWNAVTGLWWPASGSRSTILRYEDFIADPEGTLAPVLEMVGLSEDGIPMVDPATVTLDTTHTVAGNPNRHQRGRILLSADDEWRTQMPWSQRIAVTVMTLPFLHRYGYRMRGMRGMRRLRRTGS